MRKDADKMQAAGNRGLRNVNMELAKQLRGLEPGEVKLGRDFDGQGNHAQFQRRLRELAIMTDGPYITQADTARILQREHTAISTDHEAENVGLTLNLEGTLAQINREIIKRVLEEENGNQSRTARRLGISRTTLWRMLSNQ